MLALPIPVGERRSLFHPEMYFAPSISAIHLDDLGSNFRLQEITEWKACLCTYLCNPFCKLPRERCDRRHPSASGFRDYYRVELQASLTAFMCKGPVHCSG